MEFIKLPKKERLEIFSQISKRVNLNEVAIEKDWWVTTVLRVLFGLPFADNLSFKGGTSLSKCYNLIERFSEDIDIGVYREFLGFCGNLSKTQINDKLRRAACTFVRGKLQLDVAKGLENQGINADLFSVKVNITPVTTTDPEIIEIHYKSLFPESRYLKPIVKIEVSGRSMGEPLQKIALQSLIELEFPNATFAEKPFEVNAVVPERTFLEKICLLHEEFAKPLGSVRSERMSRHLYDMERMCHAGIDDKAFSYKGLWRNIVEHRRVFIGLKGFDYNTLSPATIRIIPPETEKNEWRRDYETMRETMIYGDSLPFDKLINKLKQLNERINNLRIDVDGA